MAVADLSLGTGCLLLVDTNGAPRDAWDSLAIQHNVLVYCMVRRTVILSVQIKCHV